MHAAAAQKDKEWGGDPASPKLETAPSYLLLHALQGQDRKAGKQQHFLFCLEAGAREITETEAS